MERHERSAFSSPIAGKPVRAAFDGGRLTSDVGVLLLADIERRLGIAERLARCLADPRAPERVRDAVGQALSDAEPALDLRQHQDPGIGSQASTVEGAMDCLAGDRRREGASLVPFHNALRGGSR